MNQWIPVIILAVIYAATLVASWIWVRRVEARAGSTYIAGFDTGWIQHVGAQLSTDDAYQRAYTEGWLGALDAMKNEREARERTVYDNGRNDGWHEALDAFDPYGVSRKGVL